MPERTISPASGIPAPDARRWLMLAIVLSATMMVTLDGFIVNVAIPTIERELNATFSESQLVVAGYTLAYAVLLVTGGRLGDLYGRKRLFVIGVAGFTLFSALCGFASTSSLLIAFRVAKGASAALMTPQVIAFIQVSFDTKERPKAFGAYAAVAGFASILGQVFGGFLLALNLFDLGWRSIFLVNVPIGFVALIAALLFIHESRLQQMRGLDYGGVALLTSGMFLFVFPLVLGGEGGWSLWAIVPLLLSLACLIAFVVYENHILGQGKTPLVSFELFKQTRFPAGVLTITMAGAVASAVTFLNAFYLQTILNLTPLQAGIVFLPSSIGFIVAASLSSVAIARLGRESVRVAALIGTLGQVLLLLSAQLFVPLWGIAPILVALFVFGLGMGLLVTQLLNRTLEGVAHTDIGAASGIYTTASQLAVALSVTLIGLLFSAVTARTGDALQAFIIALFVMTLLSMGPVFTTSLLSRYPTSP